MINVSHDESDGAACRIGAEFRAVRNLSASRICTKYFSTFLSSLACIPHLSRGMVDPETFVESLKLVELFGTNSGGMHVTSFPIA
jgi:hypothetical protein